MRLTFDLRFGTSPMTAGDGERVVDLAELASAARRPRDVAALAWGRRWERVRVLRDERALSGVQAGAEGLASLSRARSFEVVRDGRAARMGAAAFRARAVADFAVAMPRELALTAGLARRARRIGATRFELPAPTGRPERVTYLRTEPSLRWMGLHVGGAATHTAGVINGLAEAGVDVAVFAPERPGGIEDVPCTAVEPVRLLHLVHWLSFFDYSERIAAAAAGRPADAVYQRYALGSYAGLELARRLGVPLILEFNGSEVWAELHWGSGPLPLVEELAQLERRNLEDATLIVVVSDVLRDQLVE